MYNFIKQAIGADYYQTKYPNDGQRFVAWYLRNIHNLDPVEAKACVTDGAGDKQIDAVYIDDQDSTIFLIQGKFYSGEKIDAEPLREIVSVWMQIKDLSKLQENANDKLKSKIPEVASALQDDYEIVFELITTSSLTDEAQKDLELFNAQFSEDENINASIRVVDDESLKFNYEEAQNRTRPYINYDFPVDPGKFMEVSIGGTKAVIAAIKLKECIKIPGIKDGALFRKNVRQSLGNSNKVNKGIAKTIRKDAKDFFFFHNGITAICSHLNVSDNMIYTQELNVVNGCQSLSTIFNCSEAVKKSEDGYIMFRFYEISDNDKADLISTYTNSQSAVKARDLRSNDRNVLQMKKSYEDRYPDGYFVTKRGEVVDTVKYNTAHIIYLSDLGKQMCAWHSQRPTMSYSETRIFDRNFNQLFHKDYSPENMQALNEMMKKIKSLWTPDNPLGLDDSILSMKSYMIYHHLFAISVFFNVINNISEGVAEPAKALQALKKNQLLDQVVTMAATALNMAFQNAVQEAQYNGKVFSPQNWTKNKSSLKGIRDAVRTELNSIGLIPGGAQLKEQLQDGLKLDNKDFGARWSAE